MPALIKQRRASVHLRVELVSGMAQGIFVYGAVIHSLESQKYFCGPEAHMGTASMHKNRKGTCFCTLPLSLSQGDNPRWRDGNRRKTSEALSSRTFPSAHALAQCVRKEL